MTAKANGAGRWQLLVVLMTLFVAACSSTPERPATYTVKRGDTLYSIAWRHRLDYQQIARWNGIRGDYVIYPGQKLRLYPRPDVVRRLRRRRKQQSPQHAPLRRDLRRRRRCDGSGR